MSLKNDKFPIKRHWLSAAFTILPEMPDAFTPSRLSNARRAFLAGSNQLTAIRNWLGCGEIIDGSGRRGTSLTDLGKLLSAQDPNAKNAVTWWLFHLHLCANTDSFPYTTFFTTFDVGGSWVCLQDIHKRLFDAGAEDGETRSISTVESYFEGIERAYRPGEMLFDLGLLEARRIVSDGDEKRALRRTSIVPADILVVYATLLFQKRFFSNRSTVATPELLRAGLAKALGMKDKDLRDALARVHGHPDYGKLLQYRRQVNLDSVSFLVQGEAPLARIRAEAYRSGQVTWS